MNTNIKDKIEDKTEYIDETKEADTIEVDGSKLPTDATISYGMIAKNKAIVDDNTKNDDSKKDSYKYDSSLFSELKFAKRLLKLAKVAPLGDAIDVLGQYDKLIHQNVCGLEIGYYVQHLMYYPNAIDEMSNKKIKDIISKSFEKMTKLTEAKDKVVDKLTKDVSKEMGFSLVDMNDKDATKNIHIYDELSNIMALHKGSKKSPLTADDLSDDECYIIGKVRDKLAVVNPSVEDVMNACDLPRAIFVSDTKYVMLEDVIAYYAEKLYNIKCFGTIKLTKALQPIEMAGGDGNIIKRYTPLKLEIPYTMLGAKNFQDIQQLSRLLNVNIQNFIPVKGYMNAVEYLSIFKDILIGNKKKECFFDIPNIKPSTLKMDKSLLNQINNRKTPDENGIIFPFDDFSIFEKLLSEASVHKTVAKIYITIYRTDTVEDNKVVSALVCAAKFGKEVHAIIESRAPYEEKNNSKVADVLREAGVHVHVPVGSYKVHAKVAYIQYATAFKPIAVVSTGNFSHDGEAKRGDIMIISNNRNVTKPIRNLVEELSKDEILDENFLNNIVSNDKCVITPYIDNTLIENIDACIKAAKEGRDSAITIKCNDLSDKNIIDALNNAGDSGVKVNLIIRRECCLIPTNENIRVKSIVGPIIEHSRIYKFTYKDANDEIVDNLYISSADAKSSAFEKRIEVMLRVDSTISEFINKILYYQSIDTMNSYQLSGLKYKKERSKKNENYIKDLAGTISLKDLPDVIKI